MFVMPIVLTLLLVLGGVGAFLCMNGVDDLYGVDGKQTQRTVRLIFGSLFFWVAVVLPPFALEAWLAAFGMTTPWWAMVLWAVVYMALGGAFGYRSYVNRGFRNSFIRNLLSIGLCLLLMIGNIVQAVGAFELTPDTDYTTTDRNDYLVDRTHEEVSQYLLEHFGKTAEQFLQEEVSKQSLSTHRDERIAAVSATGLYEGTDPVSTPYSTIEVLANPKADPDAMKAAMEQARHETNLQILTDPLYAAQMGEMYGLLNPEIPRQNAWLSTWIDDRLNSDQVFDATEPSERGFYALTHVDENGRTVWNEEDFLVAARIVILGDCFKLPDEGATVETRMTEANWHDNYASSPEDSRFVLNPNQLSIPMILPAHSYMYADGSEEITTYGLGIADKRAAIPAESSEKKTNTGGNPGKTDPTLYAAYVAYQYADGSEAFPTKKLGDYAVGVTVTAKCDEKIPGYTADASLKTATMVKGGITITFVFTKDSEPTYTLTLRQWRDRIGGERVTGDQTFKYTAGYNYTLPLGILTGYVPTSISRGQIADTGGAYYAKGSMPAGDTTVDVVFTPASFMVNILYRTASGGRVPGVEDYSAPHQYGTVVNIPTPPSSEGNRYKARESSFYLKQMPAETITHTVIFDRMNLVDITVKYRDTGVVSEHFVDWYQDGARVYFEPYIPSGMKAEPPVVDQKLQGEDLFMTIWLYKKDQPADGNNYKDEATAPSQAPVTGQNPIGSGTGDPGRGSEANTYDPTFTPSAAPDPEPTPIPVENGSTGQNTDPPPASTTIPEIDSSLVTQPGGTGPSTPTDGGVQNGNANLPPS